MTTPSHDTLIDTAATPATDGVSTVLVAGATGNVGREVTRAVLAAGHPVRALARNVTADAIPAGAQAVPADLNDRPSVIALWRGVEAVFLAAGYPDTPGLLADMRAAGVQRVVLLSTGAVVGGDLDNAVTRFNVVSEAAVRDSGLEWTVLRASGFASNALRWLPELAVGDVVHEPFADVPVAVVDPADIGAVAALALIDHGHHERSYRITGPEPSLAADRLAVLGNLLDRNLQLVAQPDEQARRDMHDNGLPSWLIDAFFRFFRAGEYDDSTVDPTAPTLLGRPLRTFSDWAHTHLNAFR
jgi:uncharacterized protein YbjT (DUF2867 family)